MEKQMIDKSEIKFPKFSISIDYEDKDKNKCTQVFEPKDLFYHLSEVLPEDSKAISGKVSLPSNVPESDWYKHHNNREYVINNIEYLKENDSCINMAIYKINSEKLAKDLGVDYTFSLTSNAYDGYARIEGMPETNFPLHSIEYDELLKEVTDKIVERFGSLKTFQFLSNCNLNNLHNAWISFDGSKTIIYIPIYNHIMRDYEDRLLAFDSIKDIICKWLGGLKKEEIEGKLFKTKPEVIINFPGMDEHLNDLYVLFDYMRKFRGR